MERVSADDVDRVPQFLVGQHLRHEIQLPFGPVVEGMQFDLPETARSQRRLESLGESEGDALFVADTDRVQLKPVNASQTLQPFEVIVDGIGREELGVALSRHFVEVPARIPQPAGRAPGRGIETETGIARLRLLHDPPGVAAAVIQIVPRVHVAGHGPLGGIAVAGDLHEQGADRCAEPGLEKQVEDLAALRLGIVLEQHGSGTAAVHHADPVEALARPVPPQPGSTLSRAIAGKLRKAA